MQVTVIYQLWSQGYFISLVTRPLQLEVRGGHLLILWSPQLQTQSAAVNKTPTMMYRNPNLSHVWCYYFPTDDNQY